MSAAVIAHLSARRDAILERLKALPRLPGITTAPAFAGAMPAARDFLDEGLRSWPTLPSGLGRLTAAAVATCRR